MSKPSKGYGWVKGDRDNYRVIVGEMIRLADPHLDFTDAEMVVAVFPRFSGSNFVVGSRERRVCPVAVAPFIPCGTGIAATQNQNP